MVFKEFGNKNMPVIILLHGGGLSWWSWEPQIKALKKDYYVAVPIIDGHGESCNTAFESIEKCAIKVIEYIKEQCCGKVFAICGLSIGAQILLEILSHESEITEHAVIESALVYPIKITTVLAVPMYNMCYGLIRKRWFAKLQAKTLNVPDELFDEYYIDSSRMTKESLINMTKSNGNYTISSTLSSTKAKALILVGEKELSLMKTSAIMLNQTIKESTLKVIEKSRHGEISLNQPERYLDLLRRFFISDNMV